MGNVFDSDSVLTEYRNKIIVYPPYALSCVRYSSQNRIRIYFIHKICQAEKKHNQNKNHNQVDLPYITCICIRNMHVYNRIRNFAGPEMYLNQNQAYSTYT